ncbi:MAG: hypothetical protein KDM63_16270 [Verrucomicrobiae bacterium]|nr:hypothetical protein [Verrucomicrobiae bacterium]
MKHLLFLSAPLLVLILNATSTYSEDANIQFSIKNGPLRMVLDLYASLREAEVYYTEETLTLRTVSISTDSAVTRTAAVKAIETLLSAEGMKIIPDSSGHFVLERILSDEELLAKRRAAGNGQTEIPYSQPRRIIADPNNPPKVLYLDEHGKKWIAKPATPPR